jgi:hypothetical protein
MNDFDISPGGVLLPKISPIVRTSPWIPCPTVEELFPDMPKSIKELFGKLLKFPLKERLAVMMAGSTAFSLSKAMQDIPLGATAFGLTNTTLYFALYAAALDDTLAGNTASESAYGSYARLGLANNGTIFPAGTGTTTYTKTFPGDTSKNFATSTATGTNNVLTYLGILNGNTGTSSDKGYYWCSITSTTINSGDTPQLAQNAVTVVQD